MDYDWPGNVRELENFIERAVVLTEGEEIGENLLTKEIVQFSKVKTPLSPPASMPSEMTFNKAVEGYERQMIEDALRRCGGVQKKAAKLLGIKPTTLNEKIKKLGIKT